MYVHALARLGMVLAGWSLECLQDWGKFIRLCLPGMLMLCMEWWGFEIGVFLTGKF